MTASNLSRLEDLLSDPTAEMSLEDLKRHLNELASFRQNVRVTFCKKLARVYFMIVGSKPISPGENGTKGYDAEALEGRKKFFLWCRNNLRSGNGKEYTTTTLATYVSLGFKSSPEKIIAKQLKTYAKHASNQRSVVAALTKAVANDSTKTPSVTTLRRKHALSLDVATEVNVLMTAWEHASAEARKQFLYLVTDRKMTA